MRETKALRAARYCGFAERTYGISAADALALASLADALHRWHERLCTDTEEEDSGRCYIVNGWSGRRFPTRNTGKRIRTQVARILTRYPALRFYEQGDPRGCALYIVPADMANPDATYTRGLACTY